VRTLRSYGLAIVTVGLALLTTLALDRPGIRGTPFIPAILVSAWYGGIGPGLFAVGLSLLSIDYFIVVPQNQLPPRHGGRRAVHRRLHTVSALFVAWLTGAQRRTKASLQKAHDDLTARMQDLARAEELTSHVFEATPDAIAIVGRDYRCQRVNFAPRASLAFPPGTAVGMHLGELVEPGGFEQRLKPALDRCFAGEDTGYAAWVATKGVGRRYLAVSYSPLRPTTERVEAASPSRAISRST